MQVCRSFEIILYAQKRAIGKFKSRSENKFYNLAGLLFSGLHVFTFNLQPFYVAIRVQGKHLFSLV